MPKVGCPNCRHAYRLPESADGKVATCKCGKKFRVRTKKRVTLTVAAESATAPSPRPATEKVPVQPQSRKPIQPASNNQPDVDLAPLGGIDDDF